jgi:hypothetical protein
VGFYYLEHIYTNENLVPLGVGCPWIKYVDGEEVLAMCKNTSRFAAFSQHEYRCDMICVLCFEQNGGFRSR